MRILAVSDEECAALWDYYVPGRLDGYDLIISCGDLKAEYLSFLVTMAKCPVLYVHGNHDTHYEKKRPEGCDCIDGKVVVYNGVRILGLGGCRRYRKGAHQYTERQMRRRIRWLQLPLKWTKGVDIVVTHSPAKDLGDGQDLAHTGFESLRALLDRYRPAYMLHGHVHLNYGREYVRSLTYGDTTVINASERFVLEIPDRPFPEKYRNRVLWKNGAPRLKNE